MNSIVDSQDYDIQKSMNSIVDSQDYDIQNLI